MSRANGVRRVFAGVISSNHSPRRGIHLRRDKLPSIAYSEGHCQLIEKIPNTWVKHVTTALLTPCILVHERQGKSQEIG